MSNFYMGVAEKCATLSRALRLQVGCVIVKNNNIISFSWNGMPAGWDNNCEDKVYDPGAGGWLDPEEFKEKYPYEEWHDGAQRLVRYGLKTKPEVLHAERNALDKLARSTESAEAATMFVTHAPCLECAKSIYGAGIREIYYKEDYRSADGIKFLKQSGVEVIKHDK